MRRDEMIIAIRPYVNEIFRFVHYKAVFVLISMHTSKSKKLGTGNAGCLVQ
jgi:hypothetical protein